MEFNHLEKNELRRLVDNQKKRELTPEEKEKFSFYKATYRMGWKDEVGYKFEIETILPKLKEAGFEPFILYHNPTHRFDWSHTKQLGVDFKLELDDYKIFIEASFCTKPYKYRRYWFTKCRIARFEGLPKPDQSTYWILLTNRPENFGKKVRALAKEHSLLILTLNEVIDLLNKLSLTNIQTITNQSTL